MLNRRLPGIAARDVLSVIPFGDYASGYVPTNLTHVETFTGAACFRRAEVRPAFRRNMRGSIAARQSGSPPGPLHQPSIHQLVLQIRVIDRRDYQAAKSESGLHEENCDHDFPRPGSDFRSHNPCV